MIDRPISCTSFKCLEILLRRVSSLQSSQRAIMPGGILVHNCRLRSATINQSVVASNWLHFHFILALRRLHQLSIAFYHFGSTFEMLFANMLRKVQAASNDSLAETTFIPLLRLVSQLDMLPSGSGIFEQCVAGNTADATLVRCIVKMFLNSVLKVWRLRLLVVGWSLWSFWNGYHSEFGLSFLCLTE